MVCHSSCNPIKTTPFTNLLLHYDLCFCSFNFFLSSHLPNFDSITLVLSHHCCFHFVEVKPQNRCLVERILISLHIIHEEFVVPKLENSILITLLTPTISISNLLLTQTHLIIDSDLHYYYWSSLDVATCIIPHALVQRGISLLLWLNPKTFKFLLRQIPSTYGVLSL